jgi:hypothetical protein
MEPDQWVKDPDPVKEWDPVEAVAAKVVVKARPRVRIRAEPPAEVAAWEVVEAGDKVRGAAKGADVASLKAKK